MAKFNFGNTSLARMQGVDPDLQKVAFRALSISSRRKNGIDFSIPAYGGRRTAEEQNELFKKGVSKADGFNYKSNHQDGFALDVIPYVTVEGKKGNRIYTDDITEAERTLYFHAVAVCMLQAASELNIKIQWGGSWTWCDMPHYQKVK